MQVTNDLRVARGDAHDANWETGRCQHDQMPIMKEKGHKVLAPSNIKANDGKYRDLPGAPVRIIP